MTRGLSSIRSRSRCLVAPLHPPPLLPATLMHAGSGKPYDMFYLFVLHTVHPLSLSLSLSPSLFLSLFWCHFSVSLPPSFRSLVVNTFPISCMMSVSVSGCVWLDREREREREKGNDELVQRLCLFYLSYLDVCVHVLTHTHTLALSHSDETVRKIGSFRSRCHIQIFNIA